mmetsp:Transcript_126560/g.269948  ORF Transcript_126560/g.269948 Transcript_126560/m.269948 type:complete len:200 (-) Transcript_126560:235-834(-)
MRKLARSSQEVTQSSPGRRPVGNRRRAFSLFSNFSEAGYGTRRPSRFPRTWAQLPPVKKRTIRRQRPKLSLESTELRLRNHSAKTYLSCIMSWENCQPPIKKCCAASLCRSPGISDSSESAKAFISSWKSTKSAGSGSSLATNASAFWEQPPFVPPVSSMRRQGAALAAARTSKPVRLTLPMHCKRHCSNAPCGVASSA